MHLHRLGAGQVESRSVEKALGVLADTKLDTNSGNTLLEQRRASSLLSSIRQRVASRLRGVIFPLCSALVRDTWECWIQCWAPHYETGKYWSKSRKM